MTTGRRQIATPLPPLEIDRLAERAQGCANVRELQALLEQLPPSLLALERFARFDAGSASGFALFEGSVQIVVCGWLPGARSEIHDHGGALCALRVLSGHATDIRYELDRDGLPTEVSRDVYLPGSVIAYREADIHSIGNEGAASEALLTLDICAPASSPRSYSSGAGGAS
ncbi:MAG TPA: hypothetical protein VFF69_05605 [Phycisphaerales bacterium]|nr:hypothetical protein [Phycisphaerales bacterium]